ncbi:MAG: efflux RND transporter periplasmic adaptor subunit [Puniceicoccales bacterium]|jgi:RND family efflux transporter MFP subunit|nr:efflux RND transporter periplasmic adaptor subunit [Puniceicoccales bacterium]
MGHLRKKLFWVGLVPLSLAGCRPAVAPNAERVVPVKTFIAIERTVPSYVDAIGICVAYESVDVVPSVSGYLLSEHFEQGRPVEKGQLLYRIDSRVNGAQLQQAKGNLRIAEAQLALERSRLERTQPLLVGHYISPQDFAALRAAVEQAEGRVEAARGDLARAETLLDFCTVRAPIGGVAGCRLADVGSLVGPSQPLLRIQRMDPLYVDFSVSENEFPELYSHFARRGYLDCTVRLLADPKKSAPARLEIVNSQVTAQSGNVKLRAVMENPNLDFWPGESVRVRVVLEQIEKAVLAPEAAVGSNRDGSYVFVVGEGNLAELRPVRLGQGHGANVVFERGVAAGDRVIVEGQFLLAPKSRVAVVPDPPAQSAPKQQSGTN